MTAILIRQIQRCMKEGQVKVEAETGVTEHEANNGKDTGGHLVEGPGIASSLKSQKEVILSIS